MTVELWNHEHFFSCADERWRQLLELARTHGWNPIGTSRAPRQDELQELTSGALGADARYPDSPSVLEATDFARELFATKWRAENPLRGYGMPQYPRANYVCAADAAALAAALERGLAEVQQQEAERVNAADRFAHLSGWLVQQASGFMRRCGFVFGASDLR
jgi:hypothetical protein